MDFRLIMEEGIFFYARACAYTRALRIVLVAVTVSQSADSVLDQAKRNLRSDNSQQKEQAIQTLKHLRTRAAADILSQALAEAAPQDRLTLLDAIAETADSSRVDALKPFLDDPLAPVRKRAAYAIGLLGGLRAELALGQALATESDPGVKAMILQGLSICGSARSVPAIKAQMADPRVEVRTKAAEALKHIPGPEALAALESALGDRDPVVRKQAYEARRRRSKGAR